MYVGRCARKNLYILTDIGTRKEDIGYKMYLQSMQAWDTFKGIVIQLSDFISRQESEI